VLQQILAIVSCLCQYSGKARSSVECDIEYNLCAAKGRPFLCVSDRGSVRQSDLNSHVSALRAVAITQIRDGFL